MKTAIVLFNRDPRMHDNPALAAAARTERTVPLFVFDEALLGSRFAAPNRLAFMLESQRDPEPIVDHDDAVAAFRAHRAS